MKDAPDVVVLVVEDEWVVRDNIAACLSDAGYSVVETDSGEEAITLCNSNMAIDVVFTDINLAGSATGWDVANYYRACRADVQVIYASGKTADHQRRVPGSVFVSKPYKSSDILKVCKELQRS
jgi:CheY-like chemotaxis protein